MAATSTSTVNSCIDFSNWLKLQGLIGLSFPCLRRLFKTRYQCFMNQIWDDSPKIGNIFYKSVIRQHPNNFKLFPVQIISIKSGNSEDWDLTLLTALLLNISRPKNLSTSEKQILDTEDQFIKDLRTIRNNLAHHATGYITDSEFNQLFQQLKNILVSFGEDDSKIDNIKDHIELESSKDIVDDESVKEMNNLNSIGNRYFKEENYNDAIKYFTKAIHLPHLSVKDRAILYANLSNTRLALYKQIQDSDSTFSTLTTTDDERYRALKDAKQSRNLWPIWWKAHYRVGNAYFSINELEKAINSFERALALDPLNSEVKKVLDTSQFKLSQQQRHEHLDPRLKPQTIDEHLTDMKNKFGINPKQVRCGHLLAEMNDDPTPANVIKGHKYFWGDTQMGIKQDYEQSAIYFAEAAGQDNAEGMYNLAMLYDRGLGVKKDHRLATHLYEQAALQPTQVPKTNRQNIGVAESQHALGLRYYNGVDVAKNYATAAYWYKRAADNGCEQAANNLGIMYLEGTGIKQNSVKAEQWFQFSAKKGDPNATCTLAQLSFEKNDFNMAREWHQRARDAGHVLASTNRENFLAGINEKEAFIKQCPPSLLNVLDESAKLMDLKNVKPKPSKIGSSLYNYDQLKEYALKGSITAKQMCTALEHFDVALHIIAQYENLDKNRFIHELAEAYRTESLVVQIILGTKLYKHIETIICSSLTHDPDDEDTQICYVYFYHDNLEQNAKLLNEWKQKRPKSVHLYYLSACVNCFLKQYDDALLDCNTGLKLDPNYYELLYNKAVALRLLPNIDQVDIIKAYQDFLNLAPKDHRKVPESYYAMAQCYLSI
ncbi:unnamed protein product, partial [Rotaria sp. Silwood2]